VLNLKELVRSYGNLVDDATRIMQRIKALFRAQAIPTKGPAIYRDTQRKEWLDKIEGGARVRAAVLFRHLDLLLELRAPAKAAMLAEARRQPGWKVLRSIPYLGPVRVAQIMAIMRAPHRFRTKRNLWPYVGLAVVTRSSADQEIVAGQMRKRQRPGDESRAGRGRAGKAVQDSRPGFEEDLRVLRHEGHFRGWEGL